MTEPNLMQRMGVTPGKLALIGVLSVVLITVIVIQLPSKSQAPELAIRQPVSSHNQSNLQQSNRDTHEKSELDGSKSSTTMAEKQHPIWPELTLDSIIAFDPFAAPDWLLAARDTEGDSFSTEAQRQARKAEVLEILRKQGTKIVVISSEEKQAVIGEHSVRIGDHLEGFQITDITKQGVVLSEIVLSDTEEQ